MVKLRVAFVDGSVIEEEYPDHEIETLELMIEGTPQSLLVRVEIEDRKEKLIYQYKQETTYAY